MADMAIENGTRKSGRPLLWPEAMSAKFPAGTLDRIRKSLDPDETARDFVRSAVALAIRLRGRA